MFDKIRLYLFSPFIKNETEIPALNGVRAFAILLVILYHVWLPFPAADFPDFLKIVFSNFNSGVDLFFVLSGFLIYSGILKYENDPDSFDKTKFFVSRTLRIFPAYYFCLFVLYFYFTIQIDRLGKIPNPTEFQIAEMTSLREILQNSYADFFYVSNYSERRLSLVGWSLSIEEQFYLILPFFSSFFLLRRDFILRISVLILLYLIPSAFRIYYAFQNSDISVLIYSHTRMDALIAGMILAELETRFRKNENESLIISNFYPWIATVFLILGHSFPLETWIRRTIGFNFLNIGYGFLIASALKPGSFFSSLMGVSLFRPVARLSYTMYLWNILIGGIVVSKILPKTSNINAFVFFYAGSGAVAGCFLFSWLLYLVIEKPFLLYKKRLESKNFEKRI
ncbi:acyltransferase [Leptospira gomenensis]|uniref:Acyltransferase n=1 Tax=Leptospira gomenensis TaxID=2484974 RepID=A0A5F1Y7H0_9LEPT|nr:acyltransferase [Leptospira gomenensis]TGK28190.1 acyltransferase [Leptospira gomenensis]TGK36956.1 acyltransferase [Leptospira gomenensis]TGK45593.1 acyltransferase [Leptospira gomenensis]TGK59532.1 acyltransferase [Leptospira gomenensis]